MRRGWHSRGYLPHFDGERVTQFLTWHLADSLPAKVLEAWKHDLALDLPPERKREWHPRIERYLDAGHGSQILANQVTAGIVQRDLIAGDGIRYALHAWTVMPTHVHVLLTPLKGFTLAKTVQLAKGRTSREIGGLFPASKPIWRADCFDRWIRDEKHFEKVAAYIEWNPVKAKLCADPGRWPYSSANPFVWKRLAGLKSGTRDAE